jgi:Spy/CpxP family protein refolding chaperone
MKGEKMERTVIKRARVIAVVAFVLCFIFFVGEVGAQMAGPMMAQGAMGKRMTTPGMRPMMPTVESWRRFHPRMGILWTLHLWENYLFAQREGLGLKEDQLGQIESILEAQRKYLIRTGADLRILRIEIRELLAMNEIDLASVDAKVKSLDALAANRIMEAVRNFEKVLAVLTPEQRKEAVTFFKDSLLGW